MGCEGREREEVPSKMGGEVRRAFISKSIQGGFQLKLYIQKSRVSYATCEEVSSKRDSLDYSVRH